MIILDTTACIDYLNGNKEIKSLLSKQEDLIHITSITVYEINIGLERTKRKISLKRYNELYKIWIDFISGMEIFPLGFKEAEKVAEIYDKLEAKGTIIDDNDVLIVHFPQDFFIIKIGQKINRRIEITIIVEITVGILS